MTEVTIEKTNMKNEKYFIYNGLSLGDTLKAKECDEPLTEGKRYVVNYTYGNECYVNNDNGELIPVTPNLFNLVYTKNKINII